MPKDYDFAIDRWPSLRRRLAREYADILVAGIIAFEESDSTFSHETKVPEVMVIARRNRPGERAVGTGAFVDLTRRPPDVGQAARLAEAIRRCL